MPAGYSYDLRKKAMEDLDEGESRKMVAKRVKIGKLLYGSGNKGRNRQEIFSQKSFEMEALIIKSQIGIHLLNLLKNIKERTFQKWPNFGTT